MRAMKTWAVFGKTVLLCCGVVCCEVFIRRTTRNRTAGCGCPLHKAEWVQMHPCLLPPAIVCNTCTKRVSAPVTWNFVDCFSIQSGNHWKRWSGKMLRKMSEIT